ncbi:MAG TPA: TRAP transporter substrate-binding protein [Hyphomicrobiaceae bacterium]|jgi:TRAP-type C4-dicarboxylate transport system substrate-binding protein|nr:TRAP transporter substrate-binding protein [Hyphomicrobiaceae bacterium]
MASPTIRIGGYQGEASILTRAVRRLAASLAAVAGAGWQVEVIRDVTERGARAADLLTMVERGEIEICYFASGYLAGRVASLGAFDTPFPGVDRASLYAELDGALGARLAGDVVRSTGYAPLGFWDNGVRHISNRLRPLRHPDDCRGLSIRTLDNARYQKVLAAVGFTPVVLDVKDLVHAVETHAVDAQENPLTNTVNFGLHKTHKHLSLTGHFHGVALLLANRPWFDALAPEMQRALRTAAADATAAQRQWAIDEDALCLERLKAEGVAIMPAEEIDIAAFRAAVDAATRGQS